MKIYEFCEANNISLGVCTIYSNDFDDPDFLVILEDGAIIQHHKTKKDALNKLSRRIENKVLTVNGLDYQVPKLEELL